MCKCYTDLHVYTHIHFWFSHTHWMVIVGDECIHSLKVAPGWLSLHKMSLKFPHPPPSLLSPITSELYTKHHNLLIFLSNGYIESSEQHAVHNVCISEHNWKIDLKMQMRSILYEHISFLCCCFWQWCYGFFLTHQQGQIGFEFLFKTSELKKKWLDQFEMAMWVSHWLRYRLSLFIDQLMLLPTKLTSIGWLYATPSDKC